MDRRVEGPAYEDVIEVLEDRETSWDNVTECEHEAHQRAREEVRQPLHAVQERINRRVKDMSNVPM